MTTTVEHELSESGESVLGGRQLHMYLPSPRALGPRSDSHKAPDSRHPDLDPAEQATLDDAQRLGYLCRSGQRLQVLREWTRRCRAAGRPAVVGVRLERIAKVIVNDVERWQGPADELEMQAARIVAELSVGQQQQLWPVGDMA